MGDLTLLLDRREMRVRMEGRALRIEKPDGVIERVPLGVLGSVIVHGSPLVACDVWRALAERNVPAVLLPARGQGIAACLCETLSSTLRLRRCQHRAADNRALRLAIAQQIVGLKLQAQQRLVEDLTADPARAGEEPAARFSPRETSPRREIIVRNRAAVAEARDTATLMGLEGASAAAWWDLLSAVLPPRWRFTGRNRRPPRDPVNALLSLTYALIGAEMLRQVQQDGLDPALGFLHSALPGRSSLVLDLIEPLRPSADAFVLGLLDRLLTPRHFTFSRHEGCRLNKTGRTLYYQAWAIRRGAWPDLLPVERATDKGDTRGVGPDLEDSEAQPSDIGSSLPGQCRRVAGMLRARLDQVDLPAQFSDG